MSLQKIRENLKENFNEINILLFKDDPKERPYTSKYDALDIILKIERELRDLPPEEKQDNKITLCDFDAALHTYIGFICVETDENSRGMTHLYPALRYFLMRNGYKDLEDVPILVKDPDFDIFTYNDISWTHPREEEWSGLLNPSNYDEALNNNIAKGDSKSDVFVKSLPFLLTAVNYIAVLLSNRGNRETSYNILHFVQDKLIPELFDHLADNGEVCKRMEETIRYWNKLKQEESLINDLCKNASIKTKPTKTEVQHMVNDTRHLLFTYGENVISPSNLLPYPRITVIQYIYTHSLYFLAQVAGDLKKTNESSNLCCKTLIRQYQSDYNTLNKDGKIIGTPVMAADWIHNALDLNNFYVEKRCFKEIRCLLILCKDVWNKGICQKWNDKIQTSEELTLTEELKDNDDFKELRARFYHESGRFLMYLIVSCINYRNETETNDSLSANLTEDIRKACETVYSYEEALNYITTIKNLEEKNCEEKNVCFVDSDDECEGENLISAISSTSISKKEADNNSTKAIELEKINTKMSREEYAIKSLLFRMAGDLQVYSVNGESINRSIAKKIQTAHLNGEDHFRDTLIETPVPYLSKEGATSVYEKALWYMDEALKYFLLDGHVTNHVQIKLDISNLHDLYCNYCKDSPKLIGVLQKKRVNIASDLIPKLSPEHYSEHIFNLRTELAEANEQIFDSRLDRMTERVKNKVNNIGEKAFDASDLCKEDLESLAKASSIGLQAVAAWSQVALCLEAEAKSLLLRNAGSNEQRKSIMDMRLPELVKKGIPEDITESIESALFKTGRIMFRLPLIEIGRRISAMTQAQQCFQQIILLNGQLKEMSLEMVELLKDKANQMQLLKKKMDALNALKVKPEELIIDKPMKKEEKEDVETINQEPSKKQQD